MDNKIIGVLLIAAIIMSTISMVITMNLSVDDMPVRERTVTIVKGADAQAGNVMLNVGENPGLPNNG